MTAPAAAPANSTGEAVPSPASPVASEFVITDAPMPDHTASVDGDEVLSSRSADRTETLKAVGEKRRPGRPRKDASEKSTKPVVAMPRGGFTKDLEELYSTLGLLLLPLDAECGMAVIEAAPKCAESLNALAAKNPAVRRVLVAITQTSAWGGVIAAHAPLILAISIHHVPAVRNSPVGQLMGKKDTTE